VTDWIKGVKRVCCRMYFLWME